MTETEQLFLHIVRAFARDEQINLPQDTDLTNLLQPAKIHSLSAVVGYVLNHQLQAKAFADTETSRWLQRALFQTVIKQTQRITAFEALLDRLNEAEIPVVLFKGCVVNRYYPDPAVRTFGDIDFLIQKTDQDHVDTLMLEWGYTRSIAEGTVWMYTKGDEKYEVHTALMPNLSVLTSSAQAFITSVWENTVPTKRKHVFELEPNYHFLFLLLHLAKHMRSTGAGVRMYLDLALMLKNEPALSEMHLTAEADKLGFGEFFRSAMVLCHHWFGTVVSLPDQPIQPEVLEALEEYVMAAGVFGFHGRNPAVARLRDQQGGINRFGAIVRYVFPSYASMKDAYAFVNGRPMLLPVVWVVRWWDGLFRRRKRAANIFKGMFTEGDAAKASELLLQSIGLTGRMK